MKDQLFRKIWGRKQARPLKERQKQLLSTLLPTIQLSIAADGKLSLPPLTSPVWLEIGFGGGEHLAFQAQHNPTATILGCEPFINGVASLLEHIDETRLTNIRIIVDDARLLLKALPNNYLSRVFILFPDPWPKKRHHKRRIVDFETLSQLSRVMCQGAKLCLATDIADYALWMQDVLKEFPAFALDMENRKNLQERPADWPPKTRYELKGDQAGRTSSYMVYTLTR